MASFTLDGRPDTEALRQSFNAIVTDGSGTIDSPKLRALLKNRLGAETTETEADEMCANATITCDEFIDVCRRIRAGEVSSPSGRRYAKMMEEFDALFESLERPPLSTPTKPVDAAGDALRGAEPSAWFPPSMPHLCSLVASPMPPWRAPAAAVLPSREAPRQPRESRGQNGRRQGSSRACRKSGRAPAPSWRPSSPCRPTVPAPRPLSSWKPCRAACPAAARRASQG